MSFDPITGLGGMLDMRKAALDMARARAEAVAQAAASTSKDGTISPVHDPDGPATKGVAPLGDTHRERILEVGFSAYAEEIRQEKIEEMRREILAAMGLTEEDLKAMPADQRQAIEDAVAAEMRKRLAAISEQETDKDRKNLDDKAASVAMINRAKETGPGLGVLIALQDVGATPVADDPGESPAGPTRPDPADR